MKYVVFVSIDKPEFWGKWHSGPTDFVYYSNFLETKEDVDGFIEKVKQDYPDSNLTDGKGDHEYFIRHVVVRYDENDIKGFKMLCHMMHAHALYEDAHRRQ